MEEINMEKKNQLCELAEPSLELKDSFLSAWAEYISEKKPFYTDIADPENDFAGFVQHLKDESRGVNMKPEYVPQTTYWIVDKDGYIGRVSIRHELSDKLLKIGGHIGYNIRPSKRGLGYGNKALELILPKAHAMGLKRVLLTCDSTNTASKKIIETNGGVLENEVPGEEGGSTKLRYWIEL